MKYKPIYVKERNVGSVFMNIYKTTRTPDHFMIKYKGFGISDAVLWYLKENKIIDVYIIYINKKGETTKYFSDLNQWLASKKKHNFNDEDPQTFLSTSEMLEIKE